MKLALIEPAAKLNSLEKVYVVLEAQEVVGVEPAQGTGKAAGGMPAAEEGRAGAAAKAEAPAVSDAGKGAQP